MYVTLAGGLVILLASGDFLVRGAVAVANKYHVSPLIIGLTIVAFGTSMPELVVSITAALSGNTELAIGNIVGSNITNILLVLGLPALFIALSCGPELLRFNTVFMVAVTALFIAMAFTAPGQILTYYHGLALVILLIVFLVITAVRAADGSNGVKREVDALIDETKAIQKHAGRSVALIVGSIIALPAGSYLSVIGAVQIANHFGIPEATIGLSVIALGTSLPELATSLMAALRRHGDVAIGTVIGSNVFNILAVMGLTSLIRPIPVPESFLRVELWVLAATALLLLPFGWSCKPITRKYGIFFLLCYAAYILIIFVGLKRFWA